MCTSATLDAPSATATELPETVTAVAMPLVGTCAMMSGLMRLNTLKTDIPLSAFGHDNVVESAYINRIARRLHRPYNTCARSEPRINAELNGGAIADPVAIRIRIPRIGPDKEFGVVGAAVLVALWRKS
jgi:hypothetical protein